MAKLFPDIQTIKGSIERLPDRSGKEGELKLVQFLAGLPDEFEVYFQPFLNGDRPDIVLMKKGFGVLIIEVKEWKLAHYNISDQKNWSLKKDGTPISSPLTQVRKYKNNLFNLHISGLLEKKINTPSLYRIVQTQVYFHNETQETVDRLIKTDRYTSLIGTDSLEDAKYRNKLNQHYLMRPNEHFNDNLYKQFVRYLQPPINELEQDSPNVNLSDKQKQLAESVKNKKQKIIGVAGSGKTFVLAQRAVNSHIRHKKEVLILTFNITLRSYIKDQISKVRHGFNWQYFYIMHYHAFFKAEANNLNLVWEDDSFENIKFFEKKKNNIIKYNSIFVDEIQDYEKEWIQILEKYFLADDGEFVVFGDEKQNIYQRDLDEDKRPRTTVPGRWAELTESYRFSNKILSLVKKFQEAFFKDIYEKDEFKPWSLEQLELLSFDGSPIEEKIQYVAFEQNQNLTPSVVVEELFKLLTDQNIHPNDVCIVGSKISLLRNIDFEIRKKEKTNTTFETKETYEDIKKSMFLKSRKSLLEGLNEKLNQGDAEIIENTDVPGAGTEEKFDQSSLQARLEEIRRSKKFNFRMGFGTIKLSTIHSFKGWEISTLVLILDRNEDNDELIYTAITRCRHNLIVISFENERYQGFFESNILKSQQSYKSAMEVQEIPEQKEMDKNLAFDAILEGLDTLTELSDDLKKNQVRGKDLAFDAIISGLKELDDSLSSFTEVQSIEDLDKDERLGDYEKMKRHLPALLTKLKGRHRKYKICLVGEISSKKDKVRKDLNQFFSNLGIKRDEWDVDFYNNRKLKQRDALKSLKKTGSFCTLITGQFHHHSSRGNKKENLFMELNKPIYVKPKIVASMPKDQPSSRDITNALDKKLLSMIKQKEEAKEWSIEI